MNTYKNQNNRNELSLFFLNCKYLSRSQYISIYLNYLLFILTNYLSILFVNKTIFKCNASPIVYVCVDVFYAKQHC